MPTTVKCLEVRWSIVMLGKERDTPQCKREPWLIRKGSSPFRKHWNHRKHCNLFSESCFSLRPRRVRVESTQFPRNHFLLTWHGECIFENSCLRGSEVFWGWMDPMKCQRTSPGLLVCLSYLKDRKCFRWSSIIRVAQGKDRLTGCWCERDLWIWSDTGLILYGSSRRRWDVRAGSKTLCLQGKSSTAGPHP